MLREALIMGAGMFALYDSIRIFRRIFSHGIIWISLEDMIYWLVAAGWFFLRVCKVNNGIIRFYVILAVLAGAVLYYALLSRFLIRYMGIFIIAIKKQLKKVRKAITIKVKSLRKNRKDAE